MHHFDGDYVEEVVERLEAQAAVARQYREYNTELTRKQQLLWLLRRNEARAEQERLAQGVSQAVNELEAQTAALRETEATLETARESHFTATDGVQLAQSENYQVSAEVARLEAEIRHRRESRHEYENRLTQLAADKTQWEEDVTRYDADESRWQELSLLADERAEQAAMQLEACQERLPLAEEANSAAQEEVNQQRSLMAKADQRLQLEIANQGHARRSLQIIASRRERLNQERAALPEPDAAEFELKQEMLAELRERISQAQEDLQARQQDLPRFEQQRREVMAAVQQVLSLVFK